MQNQLNHTSGFAFRLFRPAESFYCAFLHRHRLLLPLLLLPLLLFFSSVIHIYIHSAHQQEEQTPNLPARMSPLTTTTFSSFLSSSLLALTLASSAAAEPLSCSAAALHDAASHVPTLRGVQIQEVLANPLKDWMEEPSPVPRAMPLVVQQTGPLSFCNVTVVYTHPG